MRGFTYEGEFWFEHRGDPEVERQEEMKERQNKCSGSCVVGGKEGALVRL